MFAESTSGQLDLSRWLGGDGHGFLEEGGRWDLIHIDSMISKR